MLSSYPGSSRIAFEYHVDRLVGVQLHSDGMELKHGAQGRPGLLGALRLGLALRKTLLSQALLDQLALWTKIFIHPEQLLDPTSFVGQLEAVIVGVQAGKEEAGVESTQLWGVLFSFPHLGFTPLKVFKKGVKKWTLFFFLNLGRLHDEAMRRLRSNTFNTGTLLCPLKHNGVHSLESGTWVWSLSCHNQGRGTEHRHSMCENHSNL